MSFQFRNEKGWRQAPAYDVAGRYSRALRKTVKDLAASGYDPMSIVKECKARYSDLRYISVGHIKTILGMTVQAKRPASCPVRPITLAGPKWSLADLPYKHKSEAA